MRQAPRPFSLTRRRLLAAAVLGGCAHHALGQSALPTATDLQEQLAAALRQHIDPLFSRVLARPGIYLANHSLGRPPDRTAQDIAEGVGLWYSGLGDAWGPWLEKQNQVRAMVAALGGVARGDCIIPKTSAGQGLRTVLNLHDTKIRVLSTQGEFDSIDVILRHYRERGRIELRLIERIAAASREEADASQAAEVLRFFFPRGNEWDAPNFPTIEAAREANGGQFFVAPPVPSPDALDLRATSRAAAVAAAGGAAAGGTRQAEGPQGVLGSNAWAVAGAHTASGVALVAGDMHLGLRVPTVWYRARLQISGGGQAQSAATALRGD